MPHFVTIKLPEDQDEAATEAWLQINGPVVLHVGDHDLSLAAITGPMHLELIGLKEAIFGSINSTIVQALGGSDNGAERLVMPAPPADPEPEVEDAPQPAPKPASTASVRLPVQERAEQIADALEEHGELNNEGLANHIGLSVITVNQYESRLRDSGLLDELGISTRMVDGRKVWFIKEELLPEEEDHAFEDTADEAVATAENGDLEFQDPIFNPDTDEPTQPVSD